MFNCLGESGDSFVMVCVCLGLWVRSWESLPLFLPIEADVDSSVSVSFSQVRTTLLFCIGSLHQVLRCSAISALRGVKDMEIKMFFHGDHGTQWWLFIAN